MSKEMPFMIYCLELYRSRKGMSGKDAMALFNRYSVCEYLYKSFGALHTTGDEFIYEDIDSYIQSKQVS